jgi:hypothetical protein
MATVLAFCTLIVPSPVISVLGTVSDAVKVAAPLPFTYPVRLVAFVPPLLTGNVPLTNPTPFAMVLRLSVLVRKFMGATNAPLLVVAVTD